jgi:trk system potassium uptake protein TrkH
LIFGVVEIDKKFSNGRNRANPDAISGQSKPKTKLQDLSKPGMRLSPPQVLALGFLGLILLGTVLLSMPISTRAGQRPDLLDALFTATSAVCVIGLVVVDTGTYWSPLGQAIILLLMQVGALGFMTMATMLFMVMGKRISLRERLVIQHQLNQFTLQGVVRLTKYILVGTLILESIGALLLSIRFVPVYGLRKGLAFGLFHSVSAFCNAGFDIIGGFRNLTDYTDDYLVSGVIVTLFIIGGLGFSVMAELSQRKRFKGLSLHTKMVLSITGVLLATAMFALSIEKPPLIMPWNAKPSMVVSMAGMHRVIIRAFLSLSITKRSFQIIVISIPLPPNPSARGR